MPTLVTLLSTLSLPYSLRWHLKSGHRVNRLWGSPSIKGEYIEMYTYLPLFNISLFDAMHDGHSSFWKKTKRYKGDFLLSTNEHMAKVFLNSEEAGLCPARPSGSESTASITARNTQHCLSGLFQWGFADWQPLVVTSPHYNPCLSDHPIVQGPVAPGSLPVLQQREPCVIVCTRSHSLGCHCSDHRPTKTWEVSSSGKGPHLICIFNVKVS